MIFLENNMFFISFGIYYVIFAFVTVGQREEVEESTLRKRLQQPKIGLFPSDYYQLKITPIADLD